MPSGASRPRYSGTGHVRLPGRMYKVRLERLKPALFWFRLRISCCCLGGKVAQDKVRTQKDDIKQKRHAKNFALVYTQAVKRFKLKKKKYPHTCRRGLDVCVPPGVMNERAAAFSGVRSAVTTSVLFATLLSSLVLRGVHVGAMT